MIKTIETGEGLRRKKANIQKQLKDNEALLTGTLYIEEPFKYDRKEGKCDRLLRKLERIERKTKKAKRAKGLSTSEILRQEADFKENFWKDIQIGYHCCTRGKINALDKAKKMREKADSIDDRPNRIRAFLYGANYNNLYLEAEATKKELKNQEQIDEIDLQLESLKETKEHMFIHQLAFCFGQLAILGHSVVTRIPIPFRAVGAPMLLSQEVYGSHINPMYETYDKVIDDTRLLISNLRARNNIKPLVVNSDEAVRIRKHQMDQFARMQGKSYDEIPFRKVKSR